MKEILYASLILLIIVSWKEATDKKVDTAISKQADSSAQQTIQVAKFKD